MKMCSDVQNWVGTSHIKMCSDIHTWVGTPHMKMCSDVLIEGYNMIVKLMRWDGWVVGGWLGNYSENNATLWLHLTS